jgi:hypothetical protein
MMMATLTRVLNDVAVDSPSLLGGTPGIPSSFEDSTTSQLPTWLASATILDDIAADSEQSSIGGTCTRVGSHDSPLHVSIVSTTTLSREQRVANTLQTQQAPDDQLFADRHVAGPTLRELSSLLTT